MPVAGRSKITNSHKQWVGPVRLALRVLKSIKGNRI